MKQEALEDIAERLYPLLNVPEFSNINWERRIGQRDGFITGYKLAQKRRYSEEEVRLMLRELSTDLYEIYPLRSLEDWFEEFKNK